MKECRGVKVIYGLSILSLWTLCMYSLHTIPTATETKRNLSSRKDSIGFYVIGDFGHGGKDQLNVASLMETVATTVPQKPEFVISTGDQIYEHG